MNELKRNWLYVGKESILIDLRAWLLVSVKVTYVGKVWTRYMCVVTLFS